MNGLPATLAAGDPVKVFDAYNGRRHGQPEDGWDGQVEKVGRTLVEIRYGRFNEVRKFRIDTQIANDRYEHQSFRTLAQAEERQRGLVARAVLAAPGIEFSWRAPQLPVEVLEQLATVLTNYDETKDGTS